MPSLKKAFKDMRRQGVIAICKCLCEHCGEECVHSFAQEWRQQKRTVRGFVYVAEQEPVLASEDYSFPLVFGVVTSQSLDFDDPRSLEVGQIVSSCLKGQAIRHNWDSNPGSPILVPLDDTLVDEPLAGHSHAIATTGDGVVLGARLFPDDAFDKIEGNPVRLLNVARANLSKARTTRNRQALEQYCEGDGLKLGFLVWDAITPSPPKEVREIVDRVQVEYMFVEVTGIEGKFPDCGYRGELLNTPYCIDPARLRIGSPVRFTAEHVYAREKSRARSLR